MANLATMGTPGVSGTNKPTQGTGQSGGTNPFTRAAIMHEEPCGYDLTRTLSASTQNLPDIEVPAYGYMRYIRLDVEGTGATGGTPVMHEDFPFNVIKNIIQQEPNGAQLQSWNTGYDLYIGDRYFGFRYVPRQVKQTATYAVDAAGNFKFSLYLPTEMTVRDGLGPLPNQNSAAQFRVKWNLAPSTEIYTTAPTTLPDVHLRASFMGWDQPEASADGQSNATVPVAMNTTSFISEQSYSFNTGFQNIRLTRVGNYIRAMAFIVRAPDADAGGALTRRAGDIAFPDPATLFYDTRPLDIVSRNSWLDRHSARVGVQAYSGVTPIPDEAPSGRDLGVFSMDFCHEFDGAVGAEIRDNWLRTLSSTRLEIGGQWTKPEGAQGQLTVLVNDVVTVGNVFL